MPALSTSSASTVTKVAPRSTSSCVKATEPAVRLIDSAPMRRDLIIIGQQIDDAGTPRSRCTAPGRAPASSRGWPSAATDPSTPLPSVMREPRAPGGRSTPAVMTI